MQINWYDELDPTFKGSLIEPPFNIDDDGHLYLVYAKPSNGRKIGYEPGEKFWYARVGVKAAKKEAKKNGVPIEDYLQALVQMAEVRFHSKWTT